MGGKSGGDGGAAEQARIRAEQDAAITKLNELFGYGDPSKMVDQSKFYSDAPAGARFSANDAPLPGMRGLRKRQIFDQQGYDAALAAAQAGQDAVKARREQQYQTMGADAFNVHMPQLDKQRRQAEAQLRINLANSGQSSGSLALMQDNELTDNYQRGLLDLGNQRQSTVNNARSADDQARVDLIGRIRAGMDQASALNAASATMQNNMNAARDSALAQTVQDYFGGMKYLQDRDRYQQDYQNTVKRMGGQAKSFNGILGST